MSKVNDLLKELEGMQLGRGMTRNDYKVAKGLCYEILDNYCDNLTEREFRKVVRAFMLLS